MFIFLIAGVAIAAAFTALGALVVKVTVLTMALQATALVAGAAVLLAGWARFSGRSR